MFDHQGLSDRIKSGSLTPDDIGYLSSVGIDEYTIATINNPDIALVVQQILDSKNPPKERILQEEDQ